MRDDEAGAGGREGFWQTGEARRRAGEGGGWLGRQALLGRARVSPTASSRARGDSDSRVGWTDGWIARVLAVATNAAAAADAVVKTLQAPPDAAAQCENCTSVRRRVQEGSITVLLPHSLTAAVPSPLRAPWAALAETWVRHYLQKQALNKTQKEIRAGTHSQLPGGRRAISASRCPGLEPLASDWTMPGGDTEQAARPGRILPACPCLAARINAQPTTQSSAAAVASMSVVFATAPPDAEMLRIAAKGGAQTLAKINRPWLRDAELAPHPLAPPPHPGGASAIPSHSDFAAADEPREGRAGSGSFDRELKCCRSQLIARAVRRALDPAQKV
ncbi:hypothetical protein B0J12DRAFT_774515 [Macrophomina phaseolina]|uniref:Uncharacterized protein n=1 Tax=Macrophomina phaseolina TaxID=35725 RepID=A0ABQ8GI91_9PEZI|nr:hypothetical protein B0J12DRAFT_774515 [Macrophomina phaseolina]